MSALKKIQLQSLVPTTSTIPYIGISTNIHININAMHKMKYRSADTHGMCSNYCVSIALYDICRHLNTIVDISTSTRISSSMNIKLSDCIDSRTHIHISTNMNIHIQPYQ